MLETPTMRKPVLILLVLIFVLLPKPRANAQSVAVSSPLPHFARWEGGPLELRRRQMLGQPPPDSAELEEAIRQWYTLPTLEYLKGAEIDWVWLTWSVGLPVQEEEKNEAAVTGYITECHQAGIRVLAEVSAGHVLSRAQDSADKAGLLRDSHGTPILCDSSSSSTTNLSRCYQADLRDPQWKAEVTHRALAAIQAGADGIILNDLSGPHYEAQLVSSFASEMEGVLTEPVHSTSPNSIISLPEQKRSRPLVIPLLSRNSLGQRLQTPWLALQDGVWPGVRSSTVSLTNGEIMVAGASQSPWIDSNLWLLRCSMAFCEGKPILLTHPTGRGNGQESTLPRGSLPLAMSEAAAFGNSYVVDLEDKLRQGLFEKDPEMLEEWKNLAHYQRFFKGHPEMMKIKPLHNVAVVVESCDDSAEMLNLLSRRGVSYDVIRLAEFSRSSLEPYVLLIVNQLGPSANDVLEKLERFANAGGVVVTTTSNLPPGDRLRSFQKKEETPERTHYRGGQGRWVVYRNTFPDPDTFAGEARALLVPDQQMVRMWNASTVLADLAQLVNSKRALRLFNYGIEPVEELQVQVKGSFRKGEMFAPDLPSPVPLKLEPKFDATEFTIPSLGIYGVVLLE